MKPSSLKARYSISISDAVYEEIRIDERWDEKGEADHSYRLDEGFIWSELYGQSNENPFDKWAFNYHMLVCGGSGTLESFFENHFAMEKVRRRGLQFLYPDESLPLSQEEYWKCDPRISWLYYKRSFDAVFPVLCEMGKTQLKMEIEGILDNGRACSFEYTTSAGGELTVNGKKLVNIKFFNEKYQYREKPEALGIEKPEKTDGKESIMIYGVHSLNDLFEGIEMAAKKTTAI